MDLFYEYDVCCIPVNGFELATKMGIKVIPYSAIHESKRHLFLIESEDGFSILTDTGEWRIYYNDEKCYRRINNTIMHEIGHIVLDHTQDSELAEKEVNFFAKYALVPPVLVHKMQITDPSDIAKHFDVSYEAARYAYSYYLKWLRYGNSIYTDYELTTLNLFKKVS